MKSHTTPLTFILAAIVFCVPLRSQPRTGIGWVKSVDFAEQTITLRKASGCGFPYSSQYYKYTFRRKRDFTLKFARNTQFEYGAGNRVNSSILVIADRIEFDCPQALDYGGRRSRDEDITRKIVLTQVPPDDPDDRRPRLPSNLGKFPLFDLLRSVNNIVRYRGVDDGPEADNGIIVRRLARPFRFDTGDCRIVNDPEHIQCDFAYSDTLSNRLVRLFDQAVQGLVPEPRLSQVSALSYVDPVNRVRVRFWDAPPVSIITVEVF